MRRPSNRERSHRHDQGRPSSRVRSYKGMYVCVIQCFILCLFPNLLVLLIYIVLCHIHSPLLRIKQTTMPKALFPDRGMPDDATTRRAGRVPRTSTFPDCRSVRGAGQRSTAARATPYSTSTTTRVSAKSCSGSATTLGARSEPRSGARSVTWRRTATARSTCGSTGRRTRVCAGSCARCVS